MVRRVPSRGGTSIAAYKAARMVVGKPPAAKSYTDHDLDPLTGTRSQPTPLPTPGADGGANARPNPGGCPRAGDQVTA